MRPSFRITLVLGLFLILIGGISATTYSVDDKSDWEKGIFTNTTFDRGGLILESRGVQIDWENTSYGYWVRDVEKQENDDNYVYATGTSSSGGYPIWKYDSSGSLEWRYLSPNSVRSLEVGERFVYGGTVAGNVRRFNIKDGKLNKTYTQPVDRISTLEIDEDYVYAANTPDATLWKIYKNNGSTVWKKDYSAGYVIGGLEISDSGNVFVGRGDKLIKLDEDGSYIDNTSSSISSVDFKSVEIGTDNKVYAAGGSYAGGFVERYDSDLNREWEFYPKNNTADIDLDSVNNVYASTTLDDDSTYKLNQSGYLKWVKADPDSQLAVESHQTGAYTAGFGSSSGILVRLVETYFSDGEYNSTIFTSDPFKSWEVISVESDLNGRSANLTFQTSDDSFSTIKYSEKFQLSGGVEQFNIDADASEARFFVDIEGKGRYTPVLDLITLNQIKDSLTTCNEFGLIGCWKMEEGSGQIVYDYSDRNNDGSMGYSFSPDEDDPIWLNDTSKCVSGGCINFFEGAHTKSGGNQVTVPDSNNLTFEEFSLTGAIKLDDADGSPGTIIHKENEIMVVADYPTGNIAASLYNSTECGGWCGTDDVKFGGNRFYYSDMQANYNEWFSLKVTWNGTHFSFYNKTGLVDTGSPAKVTSYTTPEDNSADLLIGAEGRNQGSHLEGPMDEIKLYNSSDLGFVPGTVVCNPAQEGAYTNINEPGEDEGRLKNDREICLQNPSGNYEFYDQDYGDVDGDDIQETCRENNLYGQRGVRWISEEMVDDYPHAFTGGIDDDVTLLTSGNFESLPDQSNWLNDQTPVPTGTSKTNTSTLGFCGGDDEGEYLITQECNTGLCSTDNSVIGVAKTPQSCVLDGEIYDLEDSDQRKIYSQGENVTFDLGSSSESVACFDGVWYDKWPISAGPTEKMEVGSGQTSSFNFKVINIQDVRKEFRIELQGDEDIKRYTEFEGREGDSFDISVPPKSSKNVRVNVFGGNSDIDSGVVRVQAVSLTDDISGEDSFEINILDNSISSSGPPETQNVPGINLIHLITLLLTAALIRFKTM